LITFRQLPAICYLSFATPSATPQFDEALMRFGDRDNCIVRASAAGLLAEMAQRHPRYFYSAFVQLFFRADVGKAQFNA
jgi:hypothetical protein